MGFWKDLFRFDEPSRDVCRLDNYWIGKWVYEARRYKEVHKVLIHSIEQRPEGNAAMIGYDTYDGNPKHEINDYHTFDNYDAAFNHSLKFNPPKLKLNNDEIIGRTLDETIKMYKDNLAMKAYSCDSCSSDYEQLVRWLEELKKFRELNNQDVRY